MNKKVTRIAILQIACVTMFSSCTKISEDYSFYDESNEEAESVTEYSHIVIEEVPEETELKEKLTAEDFFGIFDNADIQSGKIADDMDTAVLNLSEDITCKELSLSEINENDNENVLYRFSMESCEGLLVSDSDEGDMYAFTYTGDDETEYAVVIGSSMYSTLSQCNKYISTCEITEYLAYFSENDGKYMLMPIAAGNSECGIYGVIPNALYMGYDMESTSEFDGIPNSLSLSVTGVKSLENGQEIYFYLDSRFDEDVYFNVSGIYINGENVTDKISSDGNPIIIEKAGSAVFSEKVLENKDTLYLTGDIYSSQTDEILDSCSLALVADEFEISEDSGDDTTDIVIT